MTGIRIKEFVNRKPVVLPVDSTIREVAQQMSLKNVGLVVLVDGEKPRIPVGVVSERDVVRAVAKGEPLDASVKTIASTKLVTIGLEDDVGEAASKMLSNNVRHLVVLDDSKRLVGVVSIRDIVREQNTLRMQAREVERERELEGD
jgi:signal-transduction protein with cAMP-binding, CBS, and nucleotidyltransferase domain